MLDYIRKFLRRSAARKPSAGDQFDRRHVAAAALLVEAAWLDSDFADEERRAIIRLVGERFDLSADKARALVAHAERQQGAAYSGWQFIKIVREEFKPEERAQVVEMLWQVACADGTLRPFEKQMVERVGEELDLPAATVEAARLRAAGGDSSGGG
jgi:uncharacterized tellurite resistance protein B-like protein